MATTTPPSTGMITILNVDDNEAAAYTRGRVLRGAGYRVIQASSGTEALGLVATIKPQLIILDVVLPGIDGLEVCRRIKSDAGTKHLMVLQVSAARGTAMDRAAGLDCGADAYLVEPIDHIELIATVRALLRLASREAENLGLIQELSRVERQFNEATQAADCGLWDWDIRNDQLEWFGAHERLAGMLPGGFSGKISVFSEILHPDDKERVWRKLQATMAAREEQYSDEYRFVHPDSSVHWMAGSGKFFYDETGAVRMTGVVKNITERKRIEIALHESQAQLRLFASQLEETIQQRTQELELTQKWLRAMTLDLTVTEQRERTRIATELHDYLAQLLVVAQLKLSQAKSMTGSDSRTAKLLSQTQEVLDQSLTYTRTLVADLAPPMLHDFGLTAALQWVAESMQRHDLTVSLELDGIDERAISEDQAVLMCQSVRELLINASKYAHTNQATVRGCMRNGTLELQVIDYGQGFDATKAPLESPLASASKFGLFSIRERMRALGGWFQIDSTPGQGTTATLGLPCAAKNDVPTTRREDRLSATGALETAPTDTLITDERSDS